MMTSQELICMAREKSGLSRKDFAAYFQIPLRTVEDWEAGRRKMPDYVLRLIFYKLEMEKMATGVVDTLEQEWDSKENEAKDKK